MSELYKCIMACTQDNNKAHKLSAIRQHSRTPGVIGLLKLMLCPSVKYYTTKTPGLKSGIHPVRITTDWELEIALQELLAKNLRGNALNDAVTDLFWDCDLECGEVLKWCIARKNPAEIGKSQVNSIYPGLIRTQEYMGAVPGTDEALDRLAWEKGILVQKKEDGMALLVQYNTGVPVSLTSRQGEDITKYFPAFLSRLERVSTDFSSIVHHEVFIKGYPRPKANGLINGQCKTGTVGGEIDEGMYSVILDHYGERDALSRYLYLSNFCNEYSTKVPCEVVHSKEHALCIAEDYIAQGDEGAVAKQPDQAFKNGKPWFNVKIKNEFTVELFCCDTKDHKTKPGMLGAVLMVSCDLVLQVWVTPKCDADKMRHSDDWLGEVFAVTIEATTELKKGRCSADLPRFAGNSFDDYHRSDKTVADTYEEILAQEAASRFVQLGTLI